MNTKIKRFVPAFLIVGVVILSVVFAKSNLFLGSLNVNFDRQAKPIQSKEGVAFSTQLSRQNRVCAETEYTVVNSSDPPANPYAPEDKGVELGRFTVRTLKNCVVPIRKIWFDWKTRNPRNDAFRMSLANIEVFPSNHDNDANYMYRYAGTLDACMTNPDIEIGYGTNVWSYRVPLAPFRNQLTIPAKSSQSFIIRGDFRGALRDPVALHGVQPTYITSIDQSFASRPTGVVVELSSLTWTPPASSFSQTCS